MFKDPLLWAAVVAYHNWIEKNDGSENANKLKEAFLKSLVLAIVNTKGTRPTPDEVDTAERQIASLYLNKYRDEIRRTKPHHTALPRKA